MELEPEVKILDRKLDCSLTPPCGAHESHQRANAERQSEQCASTGPVRRPLLVVLLVNQSTSCRYLPPAPGQATARAARKFCHLLEKAHEAGLSNQSLYIDVGVDYGMEVLIAHAYGHPAVAFECRLQGASEFINKPFWTPNGKIPLPSSVRLVLGCASDGRIGMALVPSPTRSIRRLCTESYSPARQGSKSAP